MTTISAGAAAGLLVALMVVATSDSHGAELPAPDRSHKESPRALPLPFHLPLETPRQAAAR